MAVVISNTQTTVLNAMDSIDAGLHCRKAAISATYAVMHVIRHDANNRSNCHCTQTMSNITARLKEQHHMQAI